MNGRHSWPSRISMNRSATISCNPTWGICTRRACKLNRARSQLYRSQVLQENMRWKALAEIYTLHSFAPFSELKFLLKIHWNLPKFANLFPNCAKLKFVEISLDVGQFLPEKNCRNFAGTFCYFQFPCFHFHITLFKQILKQNFRASNDRLQYSSDWCEGIQKICRNSGKFAEKLGRQAAEE